MVILTLIFSIFVLSLGYATNILYPYHFNAQNLFILDLLGFSFQFPILIFFSLSFVNILLFGLISCNIFPSKFRFYPLLIFSLTPIFHYLTVTGSFYIYVLTFILLSVYGLILIKNEHPTLGRNLFLISSLISIYSSLPLAIMYIFAIFISKQKFVVILIFLLGFLPLILISFQKQHAFRNIYQNQITIFANPGLLSESNRLQGDSKKAGFTYLSKLSENRYLYLSKHVTLKFLNHFSPAVYFTAQEKLLGFSFTPPIFLSFLIPFIIGLFAAINQPKIRKYLLYSLVLIIPSLLSQKIIDINRLVLIFPVIVGIISLGFINIQANLYQRKYKIVLFVTIALLLIQIAFTIYDMKLLEVQRYIKYFGDNILYEVGRQ